MNKLILAATLFLMVPCLRAQQDQPKETPPQAAPEQTTENSAAQNSLPAALMPGHALDPADVDVLTGKKDRETAAAQRPAVSVVVGGYGYGNYGDPYVMNGWRAGMVERPLLPLNRFTNPFFFLSVPPRGFGRGGFRGGRR